MIAKDILNELWDIATFNQEILQIRLLMRMSDEEFNFLSNQVSSIAKNAVISASEIAQIMTGGGMCGFCLNELPAFLKFTINLMFVLNEDVQMAWQRASFLVNASSEGWEFDQDVVDSADSILRSIVYLTNVANGDIMFVRYNQLYLIKS